MSQRGGSVPNALDKAYERVSRLGGTPLAICQNDDIYGVIYLKDTVKPGLRERFDQLRRMGVRTIMLTGDNRITAAVFATTGGDLSRTQSYWLAALILLTVALAIYLLFVMFVPERF
ncbi:HAD family hydrolase [Leptolyngbya sp. 7M]|uniref:HAD family hydrolase n=1 Tax=Leptolyngbya sp. 7M TaxID=2812896 RepID=UPI001B8D2656|nr:potassium-transporting ATPase subunit F [Leptolyngbya sp. 7M]QYO64174.1 HAD family hydrolase [Leptolyngbya sp. 7M]